jgi:DNA-binding NarL/FixJ family response regulator
VRTISAIEVIYIGDVREVTIPVVYMGSDHESHRKLAAWLDTPGICANGKGPVQVHVEWHSAFTIQHGISMTVAMEPQVLLLDPNTPPGTPHDNIIHILTEFPELPLVVVSSDVDVQIEALREGATSVLNKQRISSGMVRSAICGAAMYERVGAAEARLQLPGLLNQLQESTLALGKFGYG